MGTDDASVLEQLIGFSFPVTGNLKTIYYDSLLQIAKVKSLF